MPVFQYAVFALAAVSVVFARDPLVASTGRSLLSHGNDTDTGLLVTYWGQNSAAPTYQEPDLDEVNHRQTSRLPTEARSCKLTQLCRAGLRTVQHHSNSFLVQVWQGHSSGAKRGKPQHQQDWSCNHSLPVLWYQDLTVFGRPRRYAGHT